MISIICIYINNINNYENLIAFSFQESLYFFIMISGKSYHPDIFFFTCTKKRKNSCSN